ncbi:MAG: hypothetical protein AAF078_02425 [Planctomycetota bacterium]
MGKNIAIIILSVVLLLSLAGNFLLSVMLIGVSAAMGTMAAGNFAGTLANMTVVETYPAQVSNNQPFTLEFAVTNHDSVAQNIHAIELHANLLNGINVNNISPAPMQTIDARSGGFGPIKYIFNHSIPPGQTQTFSFDCAGTQPGFWGDMATITDANLASEIRFINVQVQ